MSHKFFSTCEETDRKYEQAVLRLAQLGRVYEAAKLIILDDCDCDGLEDKCAIDCPNRVFREALRSCSSEGKGEP